MGEDAGSRQEDFSPLRDHGGYLPIADHGLIGDGSTAALVGRDGAVAWLCVPRFDAPPLFGGLLDHRGGGAFTIAPERLDSSRQHYLGDTGVLVTEMRGPDGVVRVTDALTLRSGADLDEATPAARGELLRYVEVLEGNVPLRVAIEPRPPVRIERLGEGLRLHADGVPTLRLRASFPLDGLRHRLRLKSGERAHFVLHWAPGGYRHDPSTPERLLEATTDAWRRWIGSFHYTGPEEPLVRRSAITLKLLDYFENGAIVAAPTSSLPERIGGVRNWDYRYTWVRDAVFSVNALRGVGLSAEAQAFLGWILDDVEAPGYPRVLYTLDGGKPEPEREDATYAGYRESSPVRWGNAAVEQRQHDVFGEVMDCAYEWVAGGGEISRHLWERLRRFAGLARRAWRTPDHGIWEVRSSGRPFTYSAALCAVALDRATQLAERLGLPGDVGAWRADAERIRKAVLEEAWDPAKQSLTEHLGRGWLDASLLSLPLRGVVAFDHPRMQATVEAVRRHLGAGDGLLYRYLPEESPDGLPGEEGAFLICSFWLVDNLTGEGRLDEALRLYESLCGRANRLGLLPEQIDPPTGAFLGNYPQALSHVGLIASGRRLETALEARG